MSDTEDIADGEPPVVDPYEVLGLEKEATADQIKSAYRKAALQNHPDKVPDDRKDEAHSKFQQIAFSYAILSDPVRRKRYDTTGSTSEAIVDADGFNWSDYYREQFKDSISADVIQKFANKYKVSAEEKDDILMAYMRGAGDMDQVYECVMMSDVSEDDERIRAIIDEAIASKYVPAFDAYKKETKEKRAARLKAAKAESSEAEDYAKELGVHEKLFAKKGKKGGNSENDLATLIQKRQQDRSAGFLDRLAEKYGANDPKNKRGKKRAGEEDEPSEADFQAAAARFKRGKSKKAKK
ncbi:hypothetical protein E4U35_006039 [Claviceps purpurea]|nr:hypothetical protein E4U35_006039 [Claviceps purpurea]